MIKHILLGLLALSTPALSQSDDPNAAKPGFTASVTDLTAEPRDWGPPLFTSDTNPVNAYNIVNGKIWATQSQSVNPSWWTQEYAKSVLKTINTKGMCRGEWLFEVKPYLHIVLSWFDTNNCPKKITRTDW